MHAGPVAEQQRRRLLAQRLQDHLRQALGATHDVGRPHRLVRGNQYEILHTRLNRCLGGMQGAEDIVQHALGDIVLDDGHMLVGRSMVDSRDPPGPHHIEQAIGVAHSPQDRNQLQCQGLALDAQLQLLMDAIQVELAMLEENQRRRAAGEDLPAQFRANGPARPRDHHYLPAYTVLQQFLARGHWIAPEQVGDVHFLDIVHPHTTVGQVDEAGNAAHMQRIRLEQAKDLTTPST
ncbi:hypothetical protein D3C78_1289250 [compost metagenome]